MTKNDWLVKVDNKVARGRLCGVPQNLICERLLFASIGKFDPDKDDAAVQFNINQIMKGARAQEQKKRIDSLATKMFGCHISETIGDSEWKTAVFTSMVVDKKTNMITAKLNKDIMPYILDLKSEFTMIPLESYLGLSSKYSAVMYRLLKSYSGFGAGIPIKMEAVDLAKRLGTPERAMRDSWWFKNRVLDPAISEINEVMDILITYKAIKEGRSVTSYNFHIKMKQSVKEQTQKRKARDYYVKHPEQAKAKRESSKIDKAEEALVHMEATGELQGFIGKALDSVGL